MAQATRYVVVGGGIVGLATARALAARPDAQVTLVEKEDGFARHQTGRNSGVIHSGLYYAPGSAKARLCRVGAASMVAFVREQGLPLLECGKLVVASEQAELPRLAALEDRAAANDVKVERLSPEQVREHEPEVRAVGALRVLTTAATDYGAVSSRLAELLAEAGVDLRTGTEVVGLAADPRRPVVETTGGPIEGDVVVNCAGLAADRVAAMTGARPPVRIIPFRGEYYELRPEKSHLVRGLIYPLPEPGLPFLGVHLTRGVNGLVHVGPNAVLALAREGYDWRTIRAADIADALGYPGTWRLARRHLRVSINEIRRSLSLQRFAASAARLVPAVTAADLQPAAAGVRAQAVRRDGTLVDDFLVLRRGRTVHVLNAPSPAATAALEIGRRISSLASASAS